MSDEDEPHGQGNEVPNFYGEKGSDMSSRMNIRGSRFPSELNYKAGYGTSILEERDARFTNFEDRVRSNRPSHFDNRAMRNEVPNFYSERGSDMSSRMNISGSRFPSELNYKASYGTSILEEQDARFTNFENRPRPSHFDNRARSIEVPKFYGERGLDMNSRMNIRGSRFPSENYGSSYGISMHKEQEARFTNFDDRVRRDNPFDNRALREGTSFYAGDNPTFQDRRRSEIDLRHIIAEKPITSQIYEESSSGTSKYVEAVKGQNFSHMDGRGANYDRDGTSLHPSFQIKRGYEINSRLPVGESNYGKSNLRDRVERGKFFDKRQQGNINFDNKDLSATNSDLAKEIGSDDSAVMTERFIQSSKKLKNSIGETTESSSQNEELKLMGIKDVAFNKKSQDSNSFKCAKCQYVCANKLVLRQHYKSSHVRNRHRFQCEKCDFACGKKASLAYHIQTKHEKLSFKCLICDFRGSVSKRLRQHVKRMHDIDLTKEAVYRDHYEPLTINELNET